MHTDGEKVKKREKKKRNGIMTCNTERRKLVEIRLKDETRTCRESN